MSGGPEDTVTQAEEPDRQQDNAATLPEEVVQPEEQSEDGATMPVE